MFVPPTFSRVVTVYVSRSDGRVTVITTVEIIKTKKTAVSMSDVSIIADYPTAMGV